MAKHSFRSNLIVSGLLGLAAGALLAAAAVWVAAHHLIPLPPLLSSPPVVLIFTLIFGAFSIAEIPLMVFTMRRLAVERQDNRGLVVGLNALYVFFAAVYALPVLLLTGSIPWGLALSALGIVRFFTGLLFVPVPSYLDDPHNPARPE